MSTVSKRASRIQRGDVLVFPTGDVEAIEVEKRPGYVIVKLDELRFYAAPNNKIVTVKEVVKAVKE